MTLSYYNGTLDTRFCPALIRSHCFTALVDRLIWAGEAADVVALSRCAQREGCGELGHSLVQSTIKNPRDLSLGMT